MGAHAGVSAPAHAVDKAQHLGFALNEEVHVRSGLEQRAALNSCTDAFAASLPWASPPAAIHGHRSRQSPGKAVSTRAGTRSGL